jgi:hypothetical protein
MESFWFFFSYARADLVDAQSGDVNYLEQLYLDLEKEIRRLRAFAPQDRIGFRDLHPKGITFGGDWQPELSGALAVSRTLVCLYSPSFFASENCGKEVQVFLTRRQAAPVSTAQGPPPVILPIMWNHPSGVLPLPEAVANIQYSNDTFPKDYNELGVYNLRRLGKTVEYNRFLMSMAEQIIQRAEGFALPPLAETPSYRSIPNAFAKNHPAEEPPAAAEPRNVPMNIAGSNPAALPVQNIAKSDSQSKHDTVRLSSTVRRLGQMSVLLLLLGNIAILLGSWRGVISAVYRTLGFDGLKLIHSSMSIVVLVSLLIAYSAGAFRLQKGLKVRQGRTFLLKSVALFALAAGLLVLNGRISLRQTDLDFVLMPWLKDQAHQLTQRLFQRQETPGGGFPGIGFPEPWTTAQSLVAAASAMGNDPSLAQAYAGNVRQAIDYIEAGLTPGEGWPYNPPNGPAVTEVTSWVTLAYIKTLDSAIAPVVWGDIAQQTAMKERIARNVKLLLRRQDTVGNWPPASGLPNGARTYSAVMALWALVEARDCPALRGQLDDGLAESIRRGIQRLLSNYAEQKDFRANPNPSGTHEHHPGLTAMTLWVLGQAEGAGTPFLSSDTTYRQAKSVFLQEGLQRDRKVANNTRLHDTDARFDGPFILEPSTFLWYPWTLLELAQLRQDPQLIESQRQTVYETELNLVFRFEEALAQINTEATYVLDENLFAISELTPSSGQPGGKRP